MQKKAVLLLVIITAVVFMSVGVLASSNVQNVAATINFDIKMILNGKEFTPMEADGSVIKPLIYKGRTYLPVRTLADALKTPVDWDANTSTLYLGERNTVIPIEAQDTKPLYSWNKYTTDPEILYTPLKTFKKGLYICDQDYQDLQVQIFPKGKYSKFGGQFYNEGATCKAIIREKDWNGQVLAEREVPAHTIVDFEIDITGIQTIYVTTKHVSPTKYKFILGDPYFK